MIPVVTPAEMSAIDAEAAEPVEVLIERAGWAVAGAARRMMSSPIGRGDGGRPARRRGVSGRRILVIAGPGNNGADGRLAAGVLGRWGAKVTVVPVAEVADPWPWSAADLIIDAAFGTGLRREFRAPRLDPGAPPVLAVDIPSGLDGLTGEARGRVLAAEHTVTFAAPKPGLLLGDGPRHAGAVTVADIGLDCSRARLHWLEPADLADWPRRAPDTHKWRSAVWVIGGGPTMPGAPRLSAAAAARAGAGYVLVSVPNVGDTSPMAPLPTEAVGRPLHGSWHDQLGDDLDRVGALVIGPGLATDAVTTEAVRRTVTAAQCGVVLDAGALDAVATDPRCLRERSLPAVLTPHDGEFARLTGAAPGVDRPASVREAARRLGAVVLLKGPTTIVADPEGNTLVSTAGDARLATAGTGDVLSGIIGAGLAQGLAPLHAAGLGAELHGRAADLGRSVGLVAGDLPELVADYLSGARRSGDHPSGARLGGNQS